MANERNNSMPATMTTPSADATLEIWHDLSSPGAWDSVKKAAIFKPHRRTVRGPGGMTTDVKVTADDLDEIVRKSAKLIPVFAGHPRTDESEMSAEQPDLIGYASELKVGTFGPDREPGITATVFIKRGHGRLAAQMPFRSVDYLPRSSQIVSLSLLRRAPALDLGVVQFADAGPVVRYSLGDSSMTSNTTAWVEDRPVDPHAKGPGHDEAARLMRLNPGMSFLDALQYVNGGDVAQYTKFGRGELGGEFSLENIAKSSLQAPVNGSPNTIVHMPARQHWSPQAQRDLADAMVRGGNGTVVTEGTRNAAAALRQAADEMPGDSAQLEREQERRDYNRRLEMARNAFAVNGGNWEDYRKGFQLRYDATPRIEDNPLHKAPPKHDAAVKYMRSHPGVQYVDAMEHVQYG
jgi:hypothetical protein